MLFISEDKKDWLLAAYEAQEAKNYTELSRAFEEEFGEIRHRTTIKNWVERIQLERNLMDEKGIDGLLEHDKTLERNRIEKTYYKSQYHRLIRKDIVSNNVIEAIKGTAEAFPPVKVKQYSKPASTSTSPITAVASLTDLHIGEFVDGEQMNGMNSYNFDVFNKRLYGWTSQVINLINLRRSYTDVHKLVVPMLGDMVNGEIHNELIRTNLDHAMGQMARGANLIAQSLMTFAQHVSEVEVPCVIGNHHRLSKEIYYKDKYVGWDYMLYQWVAALCKQQTNIKFHIPKSFYTIIEVEGNKILIHHGDGMRSSNGSMQKQVDALRQALATQSLFFDSMMIGHYHHVDEIDIGTGPAIMCGCMKGTDEYALVHGLASAASHVLTFWHPKHGYISRDNIYLQRFDKSDEGFEDSLNEVWVE